MSEVSTSVETEHTIQEPAWTAGIDDESGTNPMLDAAACSAVGPEKSQHCAHPTVDRSSAIWQSLAH